VAPLWFTALIAFVAPVFALLGVLVGAFMQRRTTREQLAEQRRRDRELWAREDRHRFTSEKRVIYAEFLSALERASETASSWNEMWRELAQANPERDILEAIGQMIETGPYRSKYEEIRRELGDLLGQIDLISSGVVRIRGFEIVGHLTAGFAALTHDPSRFASAERFHKKVEDSLNASLAVTMSLRAAMRAELGELPSANPELPAS
jgi:hypothetical protein